MAGNPIGHTNEPERDSPSGFGKRIGFMRWTVLLSRFKTEKIDAHKPLIVRLLSMRIFRSQEASQFPILLRQGY